MATKWFNSLDTNSNAVSFYKKLFENLSNAIYEQHQKIYYSSCEIEAMMSPPPARHFIDPLDHFQIK